MDQLYTHISTLFFVFFSHTGHYRVLSRVPCAINCINRSLLVIYFTYSSVYMGEGNGDPLQYPCLENPWVEPGRLQSMGSRRVGHDWATSLSLFPFMHWRRKWQPTPVFLPGESQGRGAWWTAVYGIAQSQTQLKRLSSSSSSVYMCVCQSQSPDLSPPLHTLPNQLLAAHFVDDTSLELRSLPGFTIHMLRPNGLVPAAFSDWKDEVNDPLTNLKNRCLVACVA